MLRVRRFNAETSTWTTQSDSERRVQNLNDCPVFAYDERRHILAVCTAQQTGFCRPVYRNVLVHWLHHDDCQQTRHTVSIKPSSDVCALAFGGEQIATSSTDTQASLVEEDEQQPFYPLANQFDGTVLAVGLYWPNSIELYSLQNPKQAHLVRVFRTASTINDLSFCPRLYSTLAAACDSGLHFYSYVQYTLTVTTEVGFKSGCFKGLAFSSDGRLMCAGRSKMGDHTLCIASLASNWQMQHELHGHVDTITSCAFARSAPLLASASLDTSIRLWSTAFWRPLTVINTTTTPISQSPVFVRGLHGPAVNAVCFAHNDAVLISTLESRNGEAVVMHNFIADDGNIDQDTNVVEGETRRGCCVVVPRQSGVDFGGEMCYLGLRNSMKELPVAQIMQSLRHICRHRILELINGKNSDRTTTSNLTEKVKTLNLPETITHYLLYMNSHMQSYVVS